MREEIKETQREKAEEDGKPQKQSQAETYLSYRVHCKCPAPAVTISNSIAKSLQR